tara:strand:+ start:844 stop:3189 length:2346 start_codon:yes stop_codon:yes gene_type:complete
MSKIEGSLFYEKINYNKLIYIINNKEKFKDQIENEEKSMRRNKDKEAKVSAWTILKKIMKSCLIVPNTEYAYIPVSYKKGKSSNNIGRWYTDKSIGLAPLCTCVRHTICEGIWTDIDQVNSHPTIMKSFMKQYGFNSNLLNKCFDDREGFLKIIMEEEKCTRDEAKTCVIACINGGKFKTNTLKKLVDEITPCINHVIELEEYKDIYNYCRKEYISNLSNLSGKVISRILQVIENNMLESYIDFCLDKEVIPKYKNGYQVSLIFDGFQLISNKLIDDNFLEEMRKYTLDKTGHDIPLKIKLFDNKLDLPSNYYENNDDDDDTPEITKLKKIQDEKNLNEKGYEIIKEEFEKSVCKVLSDGTFIRHDEEDTYFIKKEVLGIVYSNLHCYVKNEEDNVEKKLFISKWYSDENMNCVRKITFDPSRICGDDVYNKFKGFKAESLPSVPDDEVDELIVPILKHYKEVLYGEHWEYVIELDRQLIKNPTEKSGVILVLKGEQGIGKDITMDLFLRQKIIGIEYASQCGGISPLFERFETLTPNKLLCICDEVSIAEIYKDKTINEKVKNLTTRETMDWEIKNVTKITIPSYFNLRWTSNNEHSVCIPPDDRRFCVFQCSSKYKNDTKYMQSLVEACKSDRVARAYYQYLMRGDIKYKNTQDFQRNRPLTDYYKELVVANLSPFDRFLSYLCIYGTHYNNVGDDFEKPLFIQYKGFDFYEKFREWCLNRKWDANTTCTAFGRKVALVIKDDEVAINKITSNGVKYNINLNQLENYLKSKSRFDQEIY